MTGVIDDWYAALRRRLRATEERPAIAQRLVTLRRRSARAG